MRHSFIIRMVILEDFIWYQLYFPVFISSYFHPIDMSLKYMLRIFVKNYQ